jgi:hypothetical protein
MIVYKDILNANTVLNNENAQKYYQRNVFINLGKTKSYLKIK